MCGCSLPAGQKPIKPDRPVATKGMIINMRETLQALSEITGVSGDEGRVCQWLIQQVGSFACCHTDTLGNLIVEKKGKEAPRHKLLFCTQMDEAGLVIRSADEQGGLRFECTGKLSAAALAGKAVRIGEAGIPGVIGVKPVHLLEEEERGRFPQLESLTIDIGAKDEAQALSRVSPGERAAFDGGFSPFGEGLLRGRALDARVGCALLLALIQEELPYDCTFAFTVLGAAGGAGAQTAAYACAPDFAVFTGAAAAGDFPGVPQRERACALGKGPAVPLKEGHTLYPAALLQAAKQAAKKLDIPLQQQESHLDTAIPAALQSAGTGRGVLSLLVPCRYARTALPVVCESDLELSLRLLRALAGSLPAQ